MRSNILEQVSVELLSVIPLIFRATRRNITGATISREDLSITGHHIEIMKLLDEQGTLKVSEIGEKLQIPNAQMTKLIRKLVNLNMVQRTSRPTDRRTYDIILTDQARAVLREHEKNLARTIQELMSNLTEEELEDLSYSIRNLQYVLLKSLVGDSISLPSYHVLNHGGLLYKTPAVKPSRSRPV